MDARSDADGAQLEGTREIAHAPHGSVAAGAIAAGWHQTEGAEEATGEMSMSPPSTRLPEEVLAQRGDTLIVFDWDDTILPTSWLEHTNALGGVAALKPQLREQVEAVVRASANTLRLAWQLGTVIIITNSSPGWVDQSCKMFMPQLMPELRGMKCVAKPMSAPVTFKIGAFKRECRHFANVISVGDGEPERMACLKLQSPAERPTTRGRMDEEVTGRWVKSLKLLEAPTCAQLVAEHEMLQNRLMDVVTHSGHIDLRARFVASRSGATPTAVCILGYFGSFPGRSPQMGLRSMGQLPSLGSGDEEWLPNNSATTLAAREARQQPTIQPQLHPHVHAQPQQVPHPPPAPAPSEKARPLSSSVPRRMAAPAELDRSGGAGDDDWLGGSGLGMPAGATWPQGQHREQPPDFPPTPTARPPSSSMRRRNESTPSLLDRSGFPTGDDGWIPTKQPVSADDSSWVLMKKSPPGAKRPGTSGCIVGGGRGTAGVGIGGGHRPHGFGDPPGCGQGAGFIMPGGGAAAAQAVRAGLGVYKMDSGTAASNRLRMSPAIKQSGRSFSTGTLAPAGGARRHPTSLLTGRRLG